MSYMKERLLDVIEALYRTDFNIEKVAFGFDMDEEEVYNIAVAEGYDGPAPSVNVPDEPWDGFNSDAEADADVLASAGWGTDEDYGYYGGDDY